MEKQPQSVTIRHLTGARCGEAERFDGRRIAIGRGEMNHVAFDPYDDRVVSHRHCEIRREAGRAVLYDVGSLNGTFINGQRVRRAVLQEGDEVGLGREGPRMRVDLCRAVPDPAPPRMISARSSDQDDRRHRRGARPWMLRGCLALICAALAFGVVRTWQRFEGRLDRLEAGPPSVSSSALGIASPDARRGPRARRVLLEGVICAPNGRELARRELGEGVIWGDRHVVTTASVRDGARSFLRRSAGDSLSVRLRAMSEAFRVDLQVDLDPGTTETPGTLAVCRLASTPLEWAPEPLRVGTECTAELRWHPLAQPEQVIQVRHRRGERGHAVTSGTPAHLLRLAGSPGVPGAPLFDAEGCLQGIVFGAAQPNLAAGPAAIGQLLRRLEETELSATPR